MRLEALVRTIKNKLFGWKMAGVELASGRVGKLSVSVIAYIAENGDLHVNREDSGPGASMTGGEEEESIAAIDKDDKDRLLLALLERHYGGNTDAQREIAALAAAKGIKVTRFHWP